MDGPPKQVWFAQVDAEDMLTTKMAAVMEPQQDCLQPQINDWLWSTI